MATKQRLSRLVRIERKCDRIIAELTQIRILKQYRKKEVDQAIEQMHANAKWMKEEAEKSTEQVRRLCETGS